MLDWLGKAAQVKAGAKCYNEAKIQTSIHIEIKNNSLLSCKGAIARPQADKIIFTALYAGLRAERTFVFFFLSGIKWNQVLIQVM